MFRSIKHFQIKKVATAKMSANQPRLKLMTMALGIVIILSMTGFTPPQKKMAVSEHEIKAVYLFNFAQFVEWPSEVFPEGDSPIIIGILGKDPFGGFLEETIQGEEVSGHPLQVKHYANVKEIENCHILFIHPVLIPKLDNILKELKGKEILTVSDGSNFIKQGGMIRFIKESNKIRLQINLSAVKASDITISSKLLRLSEIVED
jgi:hypothetical protein